MKPARQIVQKYLEEGARQFQRVAVARATERLVYIIDWFKRVHEYAEMDLSEQRLHAKRHQLLIAALEIMQRELKVLTRLVDITLASVKNSTNARSPNAPRSLPPAQPGKEVQ